MKTILLSLIVLVSFVLVGCGASDKPLTDADKAAKQGMTLEEYKATKDAAARMNMNMDDHMKMMNE